jgi:hypothetical protein
VVLLEMKERNPGRAQERAAGGEYMELYQLSRNDTKFSREKQYCGASSWSDYLKCIK